MARQLLSDRTLKALKPADTGKRYELFDAIVPSMGVRVTDKLADKQSGRGKTTFFLLARFPPSTNPTRRALGEYPAIELADARDKAREWLALLEKGIDPKQRIEDEKQAREREQAGRKDRAFETVLARYIKARRRDGVRKVDEDERDFYRECLPTLYEPNKGKKVKPVWEGRAVDDIAMTDILNVIEGIRDRGAQRQALNMAQKIGTFFNWCADDDLIPVSPYRPKRVTIAVGQRQSRERVLSDDEIRAFWKATDDLGPVYRDVYRSLLLTGQRLNDIARASWAEIDLERKTLTVPKERFKSDRDHVIPLTDDVVAILEGVKRWKNCQWVFSLDGKIPATIGDKVKRRLDEKMLAALRENDNEATIATWVNHDLRRTVRTRLSELDVLDEVAEAVIGHMPTKLNRIYNHSDRVRVKLEALTRWQGALRTILGKSEDDNVVDFDQRREMA